MDFTAILVESLKNSVRPVESNRKTRKSMDVRTMKHAAKPAEWSEKVQACRFSGLPVKKWCKQNNVCSKTYCSGWKKTEMS